MADTCSNPNHAPGETIPDGARRIIIPALTVEWGDQDIREDWTGPYVFDSFGCLEEWAGEKAAQHDGVVLVEGAPPEGDEPDG